VKHVYKLGRVFKLFKLSIPTVWPQSLLSYVCSYCLWFELIFEKWMNQTLKQAS